MNPVCGDTRRFKSHLRRFQLHLLLALHSRNRGRPATKDVSLVSNERNPFLEE